VASSRRIWCLEPTGAPTQPAATESPQHLDSDYALRYPLAMVQPEQVREAICRALPDAQVEVEDLTGGGDHLQVRVLSSAFKGLARVQQHQLVYGALRNELATEAIHALAVQTSIPA